MTKLDPDLCAASITTGALNSVISWIVARRRAGTEDAKYPDHVKRVETPLPGVFILTPAAFGDDRGLFFESWNERTFAEAVGSDVAFVQDNHSKSARGVLRGLHYQLPDPQGKLVRCTAGAVWDVAVDIRRSSPTYTQWFGTELSAENKCQLWVPVGFAHGFVALTEGAELQYKTTEFYLGDHDRAIAWDDPEIGIEWPLDGPPSLSEKDANAPALGEALTFD